MPADRPLERSCSAARLSTLNGASCATGECRLRRSVSGPAWGPAFTACWPPPPPAAALGWDDLCKELLRAFEQSSAIAAEHPAAAALAAADPAAVLASTRGHSRWVDGEYTRNTVLTGEGFVAMLLCWSPGCSSPVHAHSDAETLVPSNCFMLVLEGELTETTWADADIDREGGRVTGHGSARRLAAGARAYINDELGVHKVGNLAGQPAVSLHVYAPIWKSSPMFDEPTDAAGAPFDAGWGDF